jgi:HD-GYP domain-containing protein (c-di-GMP phosphodiesterase class II)/Tfp pilus assembly protein PilZ
MNDKPLYNSRIIDTFIKLIKRKYSHVNVGDLLDYAEMKPYEVADQGHWFTQRQVDLFYERLVKVTGNVNIAREAGQYATSPDAIGVMRQYLLGMVGPATAFEFAEKGCSNFTKSTVYKSKRIDSNKVEITVTPLEGVNEKPYQCENRIGFLEAVPMLFDRKLPELTHPECVFKGDKVCRYIISWENTLSGLCKKIRITLMLAVLLALTVMIFLFPWITIKYLLPTSIILIILIASLENYYEKNEFKATLENLKDSTDILLEQINLNYNNSRLTNEIGQAISKQMDIDDILANVIQILDNRLDFDRGMILLSNPEKNRLVYRNGFGYSDEQANLLKKTAFHLDRPESKGVFVISFREQKPFLINDFNEIQSSLSSQSLTFAKKLGAQSFIVCPIICEGESLGILAVDNLETKRPLIDSDMSLLMGIAPVIGISIRNAALLEARVKQFNSVLHTLAASIDARDNLTAGHSEKVTEYALGICGELRLSSEYREMIRVASLLHDYGKIGVPDSILKKPGRLTPDEHDIVKSHSAKSREILEQINFEGIYCQVPEIAGSHHEKIDGTGYPKGLKGKDIPLGAKIIAVADFFEAITAKRHYRDPMPVDVAVELLREGAGKHFEKKIVDSFLRFLQKTDFYTKDKTVGELVYIDFPYKRVPCNFRVNFQIDGKSGSGTGVDMSPKGIYVAVDFEAHAGSEIALSFAYPDNFEKTCDVRGRVAWVNSGTEKSKPDLPAGFGVEFLDIHPTDETIQAFLNYSASGNLHYGLKKPANDKAV